MENWFVVKNLEKDIEFSLNIPLYYRYKTYRYNVLNYDYRIYPDTPVPGWTLDKIYDQLLRYLIFIYSSYLDYFDDKETGITYRKFYIVTWYYFYIVNDKNPVLTPFQKEIVQRVHDEKMSTDYIYWQKRSFYRWLEVNNKKCLIPPEEEEWYAISRY